MRIRSENHDVKPFSEFGDIVNLSERPFPWLLILLQKVIKLNFLQF